MFVRRLVAAFIKQRRFISLALVLGAMFSFTQATPVGAATGEWVNSTTIKSGTSTYTGPRDINGTFRYTKDGDQVCGGNKNYIEFSKNPQQDSSARSSATLYKYSVLGGCTRDAGETITLSNTDKAQPAEGDRRGGAIPPSTGEGADAVQCVINNALGWIICPISEALGQTTIVLANLVDNLLVTSSLPLNAPTLSNNDPQKAIYQTWSLMRNIANIVMAIAIIIIIYSQATSYGLSNYGIKKMLPKLVVAAIFINISYFICALLIDVFNILGAGVAGIFTYANSLIPTNNQDVTGGEMLINGAVLGTLVVGSISALVLTGGAVLAAMWPLIVPVLITVALAFLAAFAVLIFREVAIILLVIVSPIAFAAWLLPNTEDWFKKWLNFFQNLLIMYPLIMIVVYGSILASNIISQTVTVNESALTEAFIGIVALATLAIPLFALPFMVKFAGGIGNRIFGMVNNPHRGPIDRANKWAREKSQKRMDVARAERDARRAAKYGPGGTYQPKGRFRRTKGVFGAALGYHATKAQRDMELDERKANAGQAMKTMYEEKRARADTKQGQRLQELADEKFALDARAHFAQDAYTEERAQRLVSEGSPLATRAAGLAGVAGVTKVQAQGAAEIMKRRSEEAENNIRMLNYHALSNGVTIKDLGSSIIQSRVGERVRIDTGKVDASGNKIFKETTVTATPNLIAAAGEWAASTGDIPLFEKLYGKDMGGKTDQDKLREAIRAIVNRHEGTIKAKGGFDLASAPDQLMITDEELARGAAGMAEWRDKIVRAQISTLAGTSAPNIAGYKFGQFIQTAANLEKNPQIIQEMLSSPDERVRGQIPTISTILNEALNTPETRAQLTDRIQYVVQAAAAINKVAPEGMHIEIPAELSRYATPEAQEATARVTEENVSPAPSEANPVVESGAEDDSGKIH